MKTVRTFFALCAAILLAACVSATPVIEGNTPQAQAGNAIAQAEIALIKGYRLVADQTVAGVLFKSELQEILTVLDKAAAAVDTAKKFYDMGSFGDALNNALDANKALDYVEAEVAKKLRDRRTAPVPNKVSAHVPTEAEAEDVCSDMVVKLATGVIRAASQGVPEEVVTESLRGDPKLMKDAKAMVHAFYSRDPEAIRKAMQDLFSTCVDINIHPEVRI